EGEVRMSDENKPRRLRATFRNAVVWGIGWGTLGTAVATIMRLSDSIPLPNALLDGIGMGIRIGIVGGIVGAAFATFISSAHRGKRLSEINWVRFGLGGLILAGLFVPFALETMSILTGGGFVPFGLVGDDMIFSALFGGITAAGTMKLAQLDEEKNPVTIQELLERMESQSIGAGEAADMATRQRERAAVGR
ncbi:MAG: hypothetical protein ABIS03_10520, partial [Gemmatimonadaceae bacterium]